MFGGKPRRSSSACWTTGFVFDGKGAMRIAHTQDDTTTAILHAAAADVGAQVRRMHEYEASLEDLFLAIMDNLGYSVKSSDDLLRSPVEARRVDAPETMGGGGA